ncbi:MAG: acetylornithine transaminase [Thermodesulfobacteriota bacterium]
MKSSMMETADRVIFSTYKRQPMVITRGEGCRVWDSEGRSYLDFVAGIAVCNLGHAHNRLAEVIAEQSRLLVHVSNLYYTQPQVELAARLVEKSFADRVFFCNSGAEANEAAIKLARKYFKEKGELKRFRIITMEQSFHGRTMATLSATGQEKVKTGFAPLLEGFEFIPFDDLKGLREKMDDSICAVMLEPIQGEGGVRCPSAGYLEGVRRLCDETGTLLIYDEIQTGMGRTGRLFAHEHFDVKPDIMTLAKALANGLPMGAMLAKESVAGAFGPGSHASTFGGTPLVCAVSLNVLKIMEEEKILEHCREMGAYFKMQLEQLRAGHESIEEIRGIGLMLGMKLKINGEAIVESCRERGFLINCIQGNVLRFVPPLIIGKDEIDALIACLDALL